MAESMLFTTFDPAELLAEKVVQMAVRVGADDAREVTRGIFVDAVTGALSNGVRTSCSPITVSVFPRRWPPVS